LTDVATFRQALITHLREDTGAGGLVTFLDSDTSRIKPSGYLQTEDTFPAVVVEMSYQAGTPNRLPHNEQMFNVYCYVRGARNQRDFISLDKLIDLVIKRLHKVEISDFTTTIDEDFKPWEIRWDGYVSQDLWDEVLRADYRWVRFRTYGVRSSTQV